LPLSNCIWRIGMLLRRPDLDPPPAWKWVLERGIAKTPLPLKSVGGAAGCIQEHLLRPCSACPISKTSKCLKRAYFPWNCVSRQLRASRVYRGLFPQFFFWISLKIIAFATFYFFSKQIKRNQAFWHFADVEIHHSPLWTSMLFCSSSTCLLGLSTVTVHGHSRI